MQMHRIDCSLIKGRVLQQCKRANAVSVRKGRDRDDPRNYRPVLLTRGRFRHLASIALVVMWTAKMQGIQVYSQIVRLTNTLNT